MARVATLAVFSSKCRILVTRPVATVRFPSQIRKSIPTATLPTWFWGLRNVNWALIYLLDADINVLGIAFFGSASSPLCGKR